MKQITKDSVATIEFSLFWESCLGKHKDVYLAEWVNFYRDLLPKTLCQELMGSSAGADLHFSLPPGSITPPYKTEEAQSLSSGRFERRKVNSCRLEPRAGRFYPKGLLKGLPSVYKINVEPFRCACVGTEELTVDFNHPLADKPLEMGVTVQTVEDKPLDRGGRVIDWMEVITNGPGMQVRSNGEPTDFFSDDPFSRQDDQNDSVFYQKPRLVTHIDERAQETIRSLYGSLLKPGMSVLDLMSSWRSHVPPPLKLASLTGLGMNKEEMTQNPQLTDSLIHDLNQDPALPFEDKTFDAVICTVSVEYLIRPFEVFDELARILKPGGLFVHTFSNRWFPPKAISLWTELSEFERMGLVLEYFTKSGAYENLETYSCRGWPRPESDRHYPAILTGDPVYAVWGRTAL